MLKMAKIGFGFPSLEDSGLTLSQIATIKQIRF